MASLTEGGQIREAFFEESLISQMVNLKDFGRPAGLALISVSFENLSADLLPFRGFEVGDISGAEFGFSLSGGGSDWRGGLLGTTGFWTTVRRPSDLLLFCFPSRARMFGA